MQKCTLQPSRCAGKGGVWICLLVLILICIGMHSVKSETKCITTTGTVNSRFRTRRQYEHGLNSLSTADSCLLTRTLTCGPDGSCTPSVEAILGLGLEFLWEINVQFKVKYLSHACVFIEYNNKLIARWRQYQNPLNAGLRKAFYRLS